MKRKHKLQAGAGYEGDEKGHSTRVRTVDFDFGKIFAADEKVDVDAVSHGLTRADVEARLKQLGLCRDEKEVVLA